MKLNRPDIFAFHSSRDFLNQHIDYLKETVVGFNTASLARRSGISKAYFSMVLAGKRKLTEKALQKILPHLSLSNSEQAFLRLLCLFDQATSQDEKARILEEIHKLRGYKKSNPKEMVVFRYLTNWYYVAIREMSALPGFKLDPDWIQEGLGGTVSRAEIEKAIEFLLEHKFIAFDQGKYHLPERNLECIDEIYKTALANYYKQVFSLALDQLPKLESDKKCLEGHMEAVSFENFERIKKLLEETMNKIVSITQEKQKPEAVFQFSLLGFPVSKVN